MRLLDCPFCGGEPAAPDENRHTWCTNTACGSDAILHEDAWNKRVPAWRTDVENAPRKQKFLAIVNGKVRVVRYGKTSHVPLYGFCLADQGPEDFDICEPDWWMPMPDVPKPEEDFGATADEGDMNPSKAKRMEATP